MAWHRHHGGNHPHVHHHHDYDHHHHGGEHEHHHHHHGDHVYDAHGHTPAIVHGHPAGLGHWHFDDPFRGIAIESDFEFGDDVPIATSSPVLQRLIYQPQTPRPPPDFD
jgi:hypothetical protein